MSIKIKVLFYKIGYRRKIDQTPLFERNDYARDFVFLKAPLFYWLADPFVFKYNGKNYLFAECANIFSNKGHIRCLCIDEKKKKWRKVFVQKNHMSFPNVFKHGEEIYCIPETSQRNQIILFKSIVFPYVWSDPITLVDGVKCVDNIILGNNIFSYFEGDGLRKFSNVFNSCIPSQFYQDKNNNLRPAGNPFIYKNMTLFPFQLNENHYGGGVAFYTLESNSFIENKKYRLTENNLKQNGVKECRGIHTYNANEDYETIDILYKRFSILAILGIIFRKVFKRKNG